MTIGIYTIRDYVQASTLGLKTFVNDATAIRDFKAVVIANVEDFDLLKIGEYDTLTGIITAAPQPITIFKGLELKPKEEDHE